MHTWLYVSLFLRCCKKGNINTTNTVCKTHPGTALVAYWLRLLVTNAGDGGSTLVGELRAHMPCSQTKKNQNTMDNQQGPAVQHRDLCSILCNNLKVTRGKDGEGIVREYGFDLWWGS